MRIRRRFLIVVLLPFAILATACAIAYLRCDRVNASRFKQIHEGQTVAEVNDLFGRPAQKVIPVVVVDKATMNLVTTDRSAYFWHSKNSWIRIEANPDGTITSVMTQVNKRESFFDWIGRRLGG